MMEYRILWSAVATGTLLGAMFFLFTPYESAGSMLPKYVAAGAALSFLSLLILIKGSKLHKPSLYVALIALMIMLHTRIIMPVPLQLTLLIGANLGVAILLYELSRLWQREFEWALVTLIVINILFIGVQFVLYALLGGSIYDLHRIVFGSSSRFAEDYLHVQRFSGLHVEPGTYANYLAFLLSILICVARPTKWLVITVFAGLASILLTSSAVALYFFVVVLALLCSVHRGAINAKLAVALTVLLTLYVFQSGFYEHLQLRFAQQEDGSLSLRRIGVQSYLALGGEEKTIGIGFESDPCRECHFQDIGTLFNLFTRGGLLIVFAGMLLLLRAATQNGIIFFVSAVALLSGAKMYAYEAPVWLFILFAVTRLQPTLVPMRRSTM